MSVFVRSPYNYSMDEASVSSGLVCEDPSLADQASLPETDLNLMMKRFGQGAELPEGFRAPRYGDFDQVSDFQTAMNAVRRAQESFDSLPAAMRSRFHNSPQELLEFLEDASNLDEAVKLGIVDAPAVPDKPDVPAVGSQPAVSG